MFFVIKENIIVEISVYHISNAEVENSACPKSKVYV